MSMSSIQIYIFVIGTIVTVIILYSYIIYLYRSEKKGDKDYERYGNIALDDNIDSKPIEVMPEAKNENKE